MLSVFCFFKAPAPTRTSPLSLHDALPSDRRYQLRARAAEQLGEFDKARDDREGAERVPETIPTDAVAERLGDRGHQFGLDNRILRAGQLASQKNLDAVVKELNTILKIAYRPRVARLLASIELRRGRSASAVKLLETLIQIGRAHV